MKRIDEGDAIARAGCAKNCAGSEMRAAAKARQFAVAYKPPFQGRPPLTNRARAARRLCKQCASLSLGRVGGLRICKPPTISSTVSKLTGCVIHPFFQQRFASLRLGLTE